MATSGAAGYLPNVHQPEVMRSILEQIVASGDAMGAAESAGPSWRSPSTIQRSPQRSQACFEPPSVRHAA